MIINYFTLCSFILCAHVTLAQYVISEDSLIKQNWTEDSLLQAYPSAIHPNKKASIIRSDKQKQLLQQQYNAWFRTFNSFAKNEGFSWPFDVKAFHKLFCNEEGKVYYCIYTLLPGNNDISMSKSDYEHYNSILQKYILDAAPLLKLKRPYSYYSPYLYRNITSTIQKN